MNFIQPPFLKKGDAVALVAPAGKTEAEKVSFAMETINGWGLIIISGKNVFNKHFNFSGTDEERAADFQSMLDNPEIKAILCARGGYGTLRIIDKLDFTSFRKHPKWIAGYSDITVLHAHLHRMGYQSIHGTMPVNFKEDAESTETLRKILFGESIPYNIPPHPLNRDGVVSGALCGGNLSLLQALNGSISNIDTAGKILFIEDLGEYLYHLDRMMIALKRCGKLSRLKGLIAGGFTGMKENEIRFGKTAEEIIFDAVKEFTYPVCFHFPAGHTTRNLAIRMGSKVTLSVSDKGVSFEA